MHLSPKEIDKLLLHNAGFVAQKRYARGLKLNYPESVALIATQILEFIRDGESVAELMDMGKKILGVEDVLPGVPELAHEIQVEGTFPDGTKLVTVHLPICAAKGSSILALYGTSLKRNNTIYSPDNSITDQPGYVTAVEGEIEINAGRKIITVDVTNKGDRPVQVGSHYPFFETNPQLQFDREKAYGMRLNIPSGMAVRFEPGDVKAVELVEVVGNKRMMGGNGLISGSLSDENRTQALSRAREQGFLNVSEKK